MDLDNEKVNYDTLVNKAEDIGASMVEIIRVSQASRRVEMNNSETKAKVYDYIFGKTQENPLANVIAYTDGKMAEKEEKLQAYIAKIDYINEKSTINR